MFAKRLPLLFALTTIGPFLAQKTMLADETMINFEDHIKPIFREHCVSCHSDSDKSSGLSVETYAASIEGGSGGASLTPGDSGNSRLYKLVTHQEQPTMPPDQDKIDAAQIDLLKTWIDQGMPENSGSQIKRKKVQVAASVMGASGRPEGPLPMPNDLLLETPRHTQRAAAIAALAASPWSPLVAVGGQFQVSLYHVETGDLLGVVPFPEGEPQSITFSRDGRLMLVGGGQHAKMGVAALFDIVTGERLTTVGDELDIVLAADISDDNTKIALAGPQRVVRVYDIATGNLLHELKKHTDWIYSLRFSPDGLLIASGDRSNGLVVWETDTGRMYLDLIGHKSDIRSLDWRSDSLVLYSASMDNTVKMWDMNNGNQIKSWDAHGGGVTAIDICNDGTICTTGRDNLVKVWDAGGNNVGQMPNLAESGMEAAITVDGQYVIAGDWLGNVRRWKRDKVEDEKSLPANPPTLEMQIAQTSKELDALTAARDAAQLELNKLTSLTQLQETSDAKKAEFASLGEKLAALQQTMTATEAKTVELKEAVERENAAIELKRNEQLALSDRVAVARAQHESIQQKLASLENDPASTNPESAQSETSSEQKNSLNEQLQKAVADADNLQVEMNNKLKEIDDAEKAIDSIRANFQQEHNTLAVTKVKLAEVEKDRSNMEAQIAGLDSSLAEAKQQHDQAQATLQQHQSAVDATQTQLVKLNQQTEKIEAERAAFAQEQLEFEAKLAELKRAESEAIELAAAKKAAMDAKIAQIAELQKQIDALNASKSTLEAEKQATETEVQESQKVVAQIADQAAEIQGELKASVEEQERFELAYPKKQ